jgi:hypothetical protein
VNSSARSHSEAPKPGKRLSFQFFAVVRMGNVNEGAGTLAQVLTV